MHPIKITTLRPRFTAYFRKGVATISKPVDELPVNCFKYSARREHAVSKSGAGMA